MWSIKFPAVRARRFLRRGLFVAFVAFAAFSLLEAGEKIKPEELVAKHIEAIGGAEAWQGVEGLRALGMVAIEIQQGGRGRNAGSALIASSGSEFRMEMNFDNSTFPHEKFIFDGESVEVAKINPSNRSPLGDFLYAQERPLTEGLLGGTLSKSWALFDWKEREAKLKYRGRKKVEGRRLHALEYRPRQRSDLRIRLFFDPETFHHVRSEYRMTISARAVKLSSGGAQPSESRHRIIEEFSEFAPEGGLVVPHAYLLRYTYSQQSTFTMDYQFVLNQFETFSAEGEANR